MNDQSPLQQRTKSGLMRKLTLASGMVAALTVLVIAIFMIHFQLDSKRKEMARRAGDIARILEKSAKQIVNTGDFDQPVEQATQLIREYKDIAYLVLTELDGHSIVHNHSGWQDMQMPNWTVPPSVEDPAEIKPNEFEPNEKVLHYMHPVMIAGNVSGWVHVGLSLDDYYDALKKSLHVTGMVAGCTFLLGAFLSFLLAKTITTPIRSLQEFAQRVAAGATSARVELRSDDEIGDLAESINTMIGSLAQSQANLRKSLEEQTSLREKDVLLREIHHRVKNNMQMLSSLMRLQCRRAGTEEAKDILRQSEARIRSMGLIHEKLYQSDSISSIDMHSYLNTLTGELLRVGTGQPGRREIRLAVGGIQLGIDTALPCGLIVTELVQNSLKYAFPNGRDGVILVSLSKNSDGSEYSLTVWDNGVGLPPNFDPSASQSLGTRLVRMLTDQLHGQLNLTGTQGTRTEIVFKESQYRERI